MKTSVLVLLGLVALGAPAMAADGPAADVTELAPLSRWVGRWDVVSTIKPGVDVAQETKSKGTERAEWVMGGRFLKQDWVIEAGDGVSSLSGSTLMTYDSRKKTYHSWMFYSSGAVVECDGTWDEASKSMTWTSKEEEGGRVTTIKATFPDDATEKWSIVGKDRDGKTLIEVVGTNTRKK